MWWILGEPLISCSVLLFFLFVAVYYYGIYKNNFWKRKGVPHLVPKYPFLGNVYEATFGLTHMIYKQREIYYRFKENGYGGAYSLATPTLYITDPTLIEQTLIKDFTSFVDRGRGADIKLDPLTAHLGNLEGAQWKSLRTKLTPTFSSGKLKGMLQQILDCSDLLVGYIKSYEEKSEPIEVRDLMAKFSTDVIGSCVFGLDINGLKDEDSEFRRAGKNLFSSKFMGLRRTIKALYPKLLTLLRWREMDEKTFNFYTSMIKSTMEYREKNNVQRKDFVQLLMELKKSEMEKQKKGELEDDGIIIDDVIITATAFVFFSAGFETTSLALSYCLYELALHPAIQEKAYQHVVEVLKKHGGEITYEAIKDMSYVQQVFAEALRMHPPAFEFVRVATKDYTLPGSSLKLEEGTRVTIPGYSLHFDPEYYPQPEVFNPDRFSKENNEIMKSTYLPFGAGPRGCIGKRFAEFEMHVVLIKLVLRYRFTLNPKTISPLIYDPKFFLLVPTDGIWIDLHKRY